MIFGFCTSGHHSLCRGFAHRPLTSKGEEQADAICSCPCHKDPKWVDPRLNRSEPLKQAETERKVVFVFVKSDYP